MSLNKNIVSSQSSKPVIFVTQDTLLAAMKLSRNEKALNHEEVMDIVTSLNSFQVPTSTHSRRGLWNPSDLFQLVFPPDFNFKTTEVVIKDGKLISGILTKKELGSSNSGIVHLLWLNYSPEVCSSFINDLQTIGDAYLMNVGFSVGIGDCVTSKECNDSINKEISTIDGKDGASQQRLAQVTANVTKILQNDLSINNNFIQMMTAGSKGSKVNITQIAGVVGQQQINGDVIPEHFIERTLPHVPRGDKTATSHGYVVNNYFKGLTPDEFFHHSAGGRIGLIDTAMKTGKCGYIQRRIIQSIANCQVDINGSLVDENGNIVEFLYGEDGFDATFFRDQSIPIFEMDDDSILAKFDSLEVDQIKALRDDLKSTFPNKNNIWSLPSLEIQNILYEKNKSKIELDRKVFETGLSEIQAAIPNFESNITIKAFIKSYIHYKKFQNISEDEFTNTIIKIITRIQKCKVSSGDSQGVIAGQSIGEPCTQMTLNSFHLAGIASKRVTTGVPRVEEIITCRKAITTPSMNIFVKKGCSVEKVIREMEVLYLSDVMKDIRILDDKKQIIIKLIDKYYANEVFQSLVNTFESEICVQMDVDSNIILIFDMDTDIINLNNCMNICKNYMIIRGIAGIKKCFKKKDYILGEYIETDGVNLEDVIFLEDVDHTKTTTNIPSLTFQNFGINAANAHVVKEISDVMISDSSFINKRHIQVLGDMMTQNGNLLGLTRNGVNCNNRSGIIEMASFEQLDKVICDAAIAGKIDTMNGIASDVTSGRLPRIGTGRVNLILDDTYFDTNAEPIMEIIEEESDDDDISVNYDDL